MSITLTYPNVHVLREEMVALLGIPLVSEQGPTQAVKELIGRQEQIAEMQHTLTSAQTLLEEANAEVARLRAVVAQGAPEPHLDPAKLQARLDQALSERDVERGKVQALELEVKRLQELAGTAGADETSKTKRQRKAAKREGGALEHPDPPPGVDHLDDKTEREAIAKATADEPQPEGDAMSRFLALKQFTLVPGWHVLVHLDDEGAIVEGWCNRQHDGTDRWDVKLKRGGYATVPAARIRDFEKGFDESPRDYIEEALQNQRMGKPGADPVNPVPPQFVDDLPPATPPATEETNDGVMDRLVTHEERGELAEKAKSLKIPPDRMVALMQREFGKNQSAELTVAELHKLFGVMEADAKVPF